MHDAPFYLGIFAASALLAQIPNVTDFKEASATVLLGILFWYTLTRVNATISQLKDAITDLKETIKETELKREHERLTDKD